MADATMLGGSAVAFGPFRFLLAERLLLEDGVPVEVGDRALEVLLVLVRRAGELVGKDELIAAVWPDTQVEEVNLRVHVSALRRAIGDGQPGRRYLLTVPGRGYRFVGLTSHSAEAPKTVMPVIGKSGKPLPPSTELIGRSDMVQSIHLQLQQRRSVTIVGPGGIGKTSIALHVAHQVLERFTDGACFVDLSLISENEMAAGAIASALGLSSYSSDNTSGILAYLSAKRQLLLLDSCERVVDGVGPLVERVLKEAPDVTVLATSREPLRAEGERVLRLPPLGIPPTAAALTAVELMQYPAVKLFVERATAALEGFTLTETSAPVVADICVRLDGIPLAIELVAGHVASFDVQSLSVMLDDRFRLLARGRRGTLPRHQTMRAVLDWSYETIAEPERLLLRRLAVFDGPAPLRAIRDVASGVDLSASDVVAALADLADKSLVVTRIEADRPCYRLLDTTRAYAFNRLTESGEWREIAKRHARHYLSIFTAAEREWSAGTTAEWLGIHGRDISNARAALEFTFSADGDAELGILLAAAVLPVLFEFSLAEECRRWAARAIATLDDVECPDRRLELRLRTTAAAAQMYTPGPTESASRDWERVLEIATDLDDKSYQARAVWGLWTAANYGGRAHEAAAFAAGYVELSKQQNHAAMSLLGDRLLGISALSAGRLVEARERLEHMISNYVHRSHLWKTLGFVIDHSVMAQSTLARVLWLQGKSDRSWRLAESVTVAAQSHAISLGYVLLEAFLPLAFLRHDAEAVGRGIKQLGDLADQNGLAIWKAAVRVLWLVSRLVTGAKIEPSVLGESLGDLSATGYESHHSWLYSLIAEALGSQGQTDAALRIADVALARCEKFEEMWIVPELLRVRAELLREQPDQSRNLESDLDRAALLSQKQGALAWQLRIAVSRARGCGNSEALKSTIKQFDEESDTFDLRQARATLMAIKA